MAPSLYDVYHRLIIRVLEVSEFLKGEFGNVKEPRGY